MSGVCNFSNTEHFTGKSHMTVKNCSPIAKAGRINHRNEKICELRIIQLHVQNVNIRSEDTS